MDIPEYSDEETETMKASFRFLRKGTADKPAPFCWIEEASDGHPRLFAATPGKAKVPGGICNPSKRSAKNKKTIAEGLAWKNDNQGISFQVIKGSFRLNKAKKLIKLMEKAIKVRIGKIEIHAMDADAAAKVGQAYVNELAEENAELTKEAEKKHAQAESMNSAINGGGSIREILAKLSPDTISNEERQMVEAEGLDGLRRLIAAREKEELDARADQVILSPKEHAKFISGAFANATASTMKWQRRLSRVKDPEQDLGPWDADYEWELDQQVHEEFQEKMSKEDDFNSSAAIQQINTLKAQYDTAKSQFTAIIDSINGNEETLDKAAADRLNQELSLAYTQVSTLLSALNSAQDVLANRTALRLKEVQTIAEFYRSRATFDSQPPEGDPKGAPVAMWKQHATYGPLTKSRLDACKIEEKTTRQYATQGTELQDFIATQTPELEAQFQAAKDQLSRLYLLPEQRVQFEALVNTRAQNAESQRNQEVAQKIQQHDKQIRQKEQAKKKLMDELQKLKSSFFKRQKTKDKIKDIEAQLQQLDADIVSIEIERNEAQKEVNEVLSEVIKHTDEKARIEQEIRDLEAQKKKKTFGKDEIQGQIDSLNTRLEEVTGDLEQAQKESRSDLAEPQARLDAANEAYAKKDALRREANRKLNDLNAKLKKMFVFNKDEIRAKRRELEAQIAQLDSELDVLQQEKNEWHKELLEHQSVEEGIAHLKLDAATQRTNESENRLKESLDAAGLTAQEDAYQAAYAETGQKRDTLAQAQQKKAQANIQVSQLNMLLEQSKDDQSRTQAQHELAIEKQKEATTALASKDEFISSFKDSANQKALTKNLQAGDDLNKLFPESDNEELQTLRTEIFNELSEQGIESNSPLTEAQAKFLIQAKTRFLQKERELLSNTAQSATEEADTAGILAKYTKLTNQLSNTKKSKTAAQDEFKKAETEISALNQEYTDIKARREKLKPKVEKLRTELEAQRNTAFESRKIMKAAEEAMKAAEGQSNYQDKVSAFEKAKADYLPKKEVYKKSIGRIESFESSKTRAQDIKATLKLKTSVCDKLKTQIGSSKKGLIKEINSIEAEIEELQKKHPTLLDKLQKSKDDALQEIQTQLDAAQQILADATLEADEAQSDLDTHEASLETLESDMIASVQNNPNSEGLEAQILELHNVYQDQEDAEANRLLIEAQGLSLEHRDEIHDIYTESLSMSDEARDALSMFKNVEDIYEATLNPKGAPSQLQKMAADNPEEYAISMAYVDKIVADVMRLKELGQPQARYMQLLDPIPKAFWPDNLVEESQDFAEIEALFAAEEDEEETKAGFLKRALSTSAGKALSTALTGQTAVDYANNLNGLTLCSTDIANLFLSDNLQGNTAAAAWPVAATLGVVLSAANLGKDVYDLFQNGKEYNEEYVNAESLTEEQIFEIRQKLEQTTVEQVMSLGEGMTDLLYKSAFAAECFQSMPGQSVTAAAPGVGIASTAILLAMKGKAAAEAYSKHSGDKNLLEDIETDEDTANDKALQGAMKNRAERSRQQKVLATADAVGAAGALTAQIGVATGVAGNPAAGAVAAVGWMVEAASGAVSAGLSAFYNVRAAKKAQATLQKAKQGSRRAMMEIFQNSATYSTQLMLKRATEGNKAAIRFCESRGISKGALLSDKMSKGILRKMLLEDGGQTQEVQGGQSVRDMWDSLNSAQSILDQSDTGSSANDPGPVWFKVQNRLANSQLESAKRLLDENGELLPGKDFRIQLKALQKMLDKYPEVKKTWETLQAELEDEKRWKPASFDKKKESRLSNIITAQTRIDELSTHVQNLHAEIEGNTVPEEWTEVVFAA